jgi:hypothetical protein
MIFIIQNLDEFYLLKKNSIFLVSDFSLYLRLKNNGAIYLFEYLEKIKDRNFCNNFSLFWFRNKKKIDLSIFKDISIGRFVNRNFIFKFLDIIKLDYCLAINIKKYQKVALFKNNSLLNHYIKLIQNSNIKFNKQIIFIKKVKKNNTTSNAFANRGMFNKISISHWSKFMILFQNFIIFLIKKRALYFTDWSSKIYFKNSNFFLKLNSFFFWNGFYYRFDKKKYFLNKKKFKGIFSNQIYNKNNIKEIFYKSKIRYKSYYINIIDNLLKDIFKKQKDLLLYNITCFEDLFQRYKPKYIVVPDCTNSNNSLLIDLSSIYDCKIIFLVDGYQTVIDYFSFPLNKKGNDISSDYVLCPGSAYYNLARKHKIREKKLITIDAPIVMKIKKVSHPIYYDAVIVGYLPNTRRLNVTWDAYLKAELEILDVLSRLGFKNIAIKIKEGSAEMTNQMPRSISEYYDLYYLYFKKKLDLNLNFEYGIFSECLKKTKIVIGQLQTSAFETAFQNKLYYIFEPIYLGNVNLIKKSPIVRLNYFAINKKKLFYIIKSKKNSLIYNKNYLFKGIKIYDLEKKLDA